MRSARDDSPVAGPGDRRVRRYGFAVGVIAGAAGLRFDIAVEVPSPSESAARKLVSGPVTGLAEGQPRYRLLIAEDRYENRLLLRSLLEDLREAVVPLDRGRCLGAVGSISDHDYELSGYLRQHGRRLAVPEASDGSGHFRQG